MLPLFALASLASAQVYTDSFTYPDGTNVPGWTEKRGDWIISAGRLHASTPGLYSYITKNGYNLKNCVVEVSVFYEGGVSAVQFGGSCARHNGGSNDDNLIMNKVQDNTPTSTVGFDRYFTYERAGGAGSNIFTDLSPVRMSVRLRMVVRLDRATTWVDWDRNGTWDTNHEKVLTLYQNAGELGLSAYFDPPLLRSCALDDFALFDAALTTADTPQLGARVLMRYRAPQDANRVYQGACALSNSGIAIDTRKIPLAIDGLLFASLLYPSVFEAFSGTLDSSGNGVAYLNIPSSPPLVGTTIYVAFVTVNPGGSPSGIKTISNDLPLRIVQ
jgi:hypothetical protein